MTDPQVYLRKTEERDWPLMLAWRNNPLINKYYWSQLGDRKHLITWEEHVLWMNSRTTDWSFFTIGYGSRPVGILSFACLSSWAADSGIYIGEITLQRQGIGKEAFRQGLQLVSNRWLNATITKVNEPSIKFFESLGFKRIGEARPEEWLYRLDRGEQR